MTSSSSGREPLEKLAEEFAERFRRGERPALTEYVQKHPELAEDIRELFPALVEMEELRPAGNQATGPYGRAGGVGAPVPEQLGDYRILREVSHGGMGIVYEAVQESLGRHVALKVLPFHSLSSTHHLERFRREARAAAKLHHTNIVPVFGVGEHEGVHYYAMQFIQGHSLNDVLYELKRLRQAKRDQESGIRGQESEGRTHKPGPNNPTLSQSIAQGLLTGEFRADELGQLKSSSDHSPLTTHHSPSSELTTQSEAQYFRSVAQVGVQVAEALAYAHQQGILHRDIKPSNLLLDTQGTIWVTDFGLVKEEGSSELTSPGDIVGTLRYMAPERFQGKADARSDVYGLGLTLYEMLTLEPAFEDTDRARLMDRVRREEPPRPRKLDPRIPSDLETIVLKAIAKEPGGRYATATALAEDLRRFLADRPIQARRTSAWEHAWRWCRRNRLVACLTGMVMLSMAVAVVVLALSISRISEEKNQKDIALGTSQANYLEAKKQESLAKEHESTAKSQELLARRRYYAAQMNLAYQAWEAGNIARVLDLLESQRPKLDEEDLRTFEWYYLWRLCYTGRRLTLRGHTGNVHSIAFSPDGQTLASGSGYDWSRRGSMKLWDLATGRVRFTLPINSYVASVAFSPDGKTLASGSWDKPFLSLWDVSTGQLMRTFEGRQGYLWSVAFSRDGKTLISGSQDRTVVLWDVTTGQARATLRQDSPVLSVAVSPDGKTIASATTWNGVVKVWDLASGKDRFTVQGWAGPVAFSSDGTLATGGGSVNLWDVRTGQARPKVPGASATALAFSPDGKTLALAGHDKNVRLCDVATGRMRTHQGRHALINSIAFSPDGKTLATAGNDSTIELWDLDPPNEPGTLAHAGGAFAVAFSPDGKTLASAGNSGTRLWDVASGHQIAAFSAGLAHYGTLAFSHNGKTLAIAQANSVKLIDVARRQELHTLAGQRGRVLGVEFAPDKKTLGSISDDGTLKLWDLATARARTTIQVRDTYMGLAFSPDGRTLATCGQYLRIDLWDPATGTRKAKLESQEGEHSQWNWDVAFSPDGKTLAAGGQQGSLKLWDVETGLLRAALKGHTEAIVSLDFSPDGKTLASGCGDRTVKLWDVATGQERATLKGFGGGWNASMDFSPDGTALAIIGEDRNVKLLRVATDPEAKARKTDVDLDDADERGRN